MKYKFFNTSPNRFRCRICDKVFCSECKVIPYHLGMTCTQKAFGGERVCRFCHAEIPESFLSFQQVMKEEGDNFI
jgi:hypothetical protein